MVRPILLFRFEMNNHTSSLCTATRTPSKKFCRVPAVGRPQLPKYIYCTSRNTCEDVHQNGNQKMTNKKLIGKNFEGEQNLEYQVDYFTTRLEVNASLRRLGGCFVANDLIRNHRCLHQ